MCVQRTEQQHVNVGRSPKWGNTIKGGGGFIWWVKMEGEWGMSSGVVVNGGKERNE